MNCMLTKFFSLTCIYHLNTDELRMKCLKQSQSLSLAK